jgi:hypothetical protein
LSSKSTKDKLERTFKKNFGQNSSINSRALPLDRLKSAIDRLTRIWTELSGLEINVANTQMTSQQNWGNQYVEKIADLTENLDRYLSEARTQNFTTDNLSYKCNNNDNLDKKLVPETEFQCNVSQLPVCLSPAQSKLA